MLRTALRNRNALSVTIITIGLFLVVIGPCVWILLSTDDEFKELVETVRTGDLQVPPPSENVALWPLVSQKGLRTLVRSIGEPYEQSHQPSGRIEASLPEIIRIDQECHLWDIVFCSNDHCQWCPARLC